MSTIIGLRSDTHSLTVTIYKPGTSQILTKGVWDKKTGGEVDSEETIYYPGDMGDRISLGGRQNPGNITLSRLCRAQRDWAILPALMAAVGKARVVIADTPLDADKSVVGSPLTYTGKLKRVTPPEVDSESSTASLVEIEVTTDGAPS